MNDCFIKADRTRDMGHPVHNYEWCQCTVVDQWQMPRVGWSVCQNFLNVKLPCSYRSFFSIIFIFKIPITILFFTMTITMPSQLPAWFWCASAGTYLTVVLIQLSDARRGDRRGRRRHVSSPSSTRASSTTAVLPLSGMSFSLKKGEIITSKIQSYGIRRRG